MEIEIDALDIAIYAVLEGSSNPITMMSTIATMAFHHDARFDWVGFYRNRGDDVLEIGPYQGLLGCLEIPFGKGVCGHVAKTGEGIIVPDVNAFADHIACSSKTRSEMVLPVHNKHAEFLGVLDFDSNALDAFVQNDLTLFTKILKTVFADVGLEQIAWKL